MNVEAPMNDARSRPMTSGDRSLLMVDEDHSFATRLMRALEQRGFQPRHVGGAADALKDIAAIPPAFALVDLRLAGGTGLDIVTALHLKRKDARIVVLTAYGNIATAVAAIKMGATDYLCKPSGIDEVAGALLQTALDRPAPPDNPMSADRVRWEHIQRVFELYGHNVSETARRLSMHRRTLQRILAKNAPR